MVKVLKEMLLQIDMSQELIIIYNNPVCHEEIVKSGFYKIKEFPDAWGNGIFLYSNFKSIKRISL